MSRFGDAPRTFDAIGKFAEPIRTLGLRRISDLALLSDDDLDQMGMPVDLRVNIRISIG